jgi:hypothetical protein
MSLTHDQDAETAVPGRVREQDLGRASDGMVRPGTEARPDLAARSTSGEVRGGWGAVTGTGRRGGHPGLRGSVSRLQAAAGNAAVAGLLGARASDARGTRRVGPTLHHAADADVLGSEPGTAAPLGTDAPAQLDEPGQAPATPAPTTSFTKVGPPSNSTYTVSGTLRQAAEAVGARREAGATVTSPDLVSANNGTRMTQAQVTVTQAVQLPEWDGKASATQNQRAEWDRFKAAITTHEAGHVATDVKAFAGAHTRILAKRTLAESNTEYDTIVTRADTDNETFDTNTDHGRNAGTTINPNIDEVTKVP